MSTERVTASELLERLNLLDENERVEAKAASEIGKLLMETVSAFANEPGLGDGWLFLGVVREELALFPSYQIEGLDQPDKVSADLASQAANMFSRPLRLDIQTEEVDDKAVIVAFVPESAPQDKPVHLKAKGLPQGALVDTLMASQGLRKLRDAGLLERRGRGSATWYEPGARISEGEGHPPSDRKGLSSNPDGLSSNPGSLSSNPGTPDGTRDGPSGGVGTSGEATRQDLLDELPESLVSRVVGIGQRRPPEEVREIIVALCRRRPYRTEELARLLARNPETIRQNYLRPLLKDGGLVMTRPEEPNDPQQSYRTAEASA